MGYLRNRSNKKVIVKNKARFAKQKLPLRDYISEPEFDKLISMIEEGLLCNPSEVKRIKAMFYLLYLFGLRIGELRVIKLSQIKDLCDKGVTSITESKTNKRRLLAVSEIWRMKLKRMVSEIDSPSIYLCSSSRSENKPYERSYFNEKINKMLREFALTHGVNKVITCHSFRISVVTKLIEVSSIEDTRQFIGHSDVSTTLRYSRYNISENKIKSLVDMHTVRNIRKAK